MPVTNTKFSLNLATVKDKEASAQDDIPSARTSEIVEGLIWLGNVKDAKNIVKLKQLGITHILNCADDVSNYFEGEFVYCNLQVKDFARDSGISRVFPRALQFVQEVRDSKGRMLVHCMAGQNRSVTISIIILMHLHQWTLRQSYDYLLAKREGICPFDDNKRELIQYELRSYGSNSMNEKDFILVQNLRRPETAHL
uniref:protein-tyrosine-phosphatase n=1 Tax=Arcella intermedia TaxID=1963864 RepID=A0A6B2LJ32_9EUKA